MERFHDLLTTEKPQADGLGKLTVFSGVREFPARVKCATLAWHTLKSALTGESEAVSTE
jgi:nitrogen fixation NifU-like protein